MVFQFANLLCPNSTHNKIVFCAFEAIDSDHNVHTVLARYQEEVATLQLSQWRYSTVSSLITHANRMCYYELQTN